MHFRCGRPEKPTSVDLVDDDVATLSNKLASEGGNCSFITNERDHANAFFHVEHDRSFTLQHLQTLWKPITQTGNDRFTGNIFDHGDPLNLEIMRDEVAVGVDQ